MHITFTLFSFFSGSIYIFQITLQVLFQITLSYYVKFKYIITEYSQFFPSIPHNIAVIHSLIHKVSQPNTLLLLLFWTKCYLLAQLRIRKNTGWSQDGSEGRHQVSVSPQLGCLPLLVGSRMPKEMGGTPK